LEIEGLDILAYGISYQKVNGDTVKFKVKAIKDREYSAKSFKKENTCYAEATTCDNLLNILLFKQGSELLEMGYSSL